MPLYKYVYSKRTKNRKTNAARYRFSKTETNTKTVTVDCAIMNWNL